MQSGICRRLWRHSSSGRPSHASFHRGRDPLHYALGGRAHSRHGMRQRSTRRPRSPRAERPPLMGTCIPALPRRYGRLGCRQGGRVPLSLALRHSMIVLRAARADSRAWHSNHGQQAFAHAQVTALPSHGNQAGHTRRRAQQTTPSGAHTSLVPRLGDPPSVVAVRMGQSVTEPRWQPRRTPPNRTPAEGRRPGRGHTAVLG
jgi:hypothetical protein